MPELYIRHNRWLKNIYESLLQMVWPNAATMKLPVSAIIFDLGDVLFNWSSDVTSIPKSTLRAILTSSTWNEYECGRPLEQHECYKKVSKEFGVSEADVASAFAQARDSLTPDASMFKLIKELKDTHPGLKVYAMSNISAPDWEVIQAKLDAPQWALFDGRFPSWQAGLRKPNAEFFNHVIREADLDPTSTVFVDDNANNIQTAKSLGFCAIQFQSREQAIGELVKVFRYGDAVDKGSQYLQANKKQHLSVTSPLTTEHFNFAIANGMKTCPVSVTSGSPVEGDGIIIGDNFANLLLLEATKDPELVDLDPPRKTWNFFTGGEGQLTTREFPDDLDTTSIAYTALNDHDGLPWVMDQMLTHVNSDGIIQTYFDPTRPRVDPVVCANVLTLFHSNGRGEELAKTLEYVLSVLKDEEGYRDGTRYYASAECFLAALTRLLMKSKDDELRDALLPLLRERVEARDDLEVDAMTLALRVMACNFVGVKNQEAIDKLLSLQREDGGWELGWIYKYGSSGLLIGNRGLTTAYAMRAIQGVA